MSIFRDGWNNADYNVRNDQNVLKKKYQLPLASRIYSSAYAKWIGWSGFELCCMLLCTKCMDGHTGLSCIYILSLLEYFRGRRRTLNKWIERRVVHFNGHYTHLTFPSCIWILFQTTEHRLSLLVRRCLKSTSEREQFTFTVLREI